MRLNKPKLVLSIKFISQYYTTGNKYQQLKGVLDKKPGRRKTLDKTLYCPVVDCALEKAKILCPEHCNEGNYRYVISYNIN